MTTINQKSGGRILQKALYQLLDEQQKTKFLIPLLSKFPNIKLVKVDRNKEIEGLVSSYKFNTFRHAWGFVSQLALFAAEKRHHPTIINTYRDVKIIWTTHDQQGITQLDIDMAKKSHLLALEMKAAILDADTNVDN